MTVETLATEILIAAPVERVWTTLTDFAGYGAWNPYLVQVQGEARGGSEIVVHARMGPDAPVTTQTVEVISAEPFRMRWEGGLPDRGRFKGDHWFVLERQGSGTRLRHFEHFSGTQAAAILGAHREVIRANFERFNQGLRSVCEAG